MSISPIKKIIYGEYNWLISETGKATGLDYDIKTWDHNTRNEIDSIVQSGYQRFCFPSPVSRMVETTKGDETETKKEQVHKAPHHWSFLNPITEIKFESGQNTYEMPEDFAQVSGDLVSSDGRIPRVSEEALRSILEKSPDSGNPEYFAIRPSKDRYELIVYPTPSESKTYSIRYVMSPLPLDQINNKPIGGKHHADTILQSCILVAAERGKGIDIGVATSRFNERLMASILIDRQSKSTEDDIWQSSEKNAVKNLVGRYLGYGANPFGWTQAQKSMIDETVRAAKRKFYNPEILPGDKYAHQWSFLKVVTTITLVQGRFEVDLPEDFASLDSPLTYTDDSARQWRNIDVVAEHLIRKQQQNQSTQTRPRYAAVRVKTAESETRYELTVYPKPDSNYDVRMQYRVNSEREDVVLGGDIHFQTFLYACYVCADELNHKPNSKYQATYMKRLAASVSHDRDKAPAKMGANIDRSDNVDLFYYNGDWHQWDNNLVTYTGHNIGD